MRGRGAPGRCQGWQAGCRLPALLHKRAAAVACLQQEAMPVFRSWSAGSFCLPHGLRLPADLATLQRVLCSLYDGACRQLSCLPHCWHAGADVACWRGTLQVHAAGGCGTLYD